MIYEDYFLHFSVWVTITVIEKLIMRNGTHHYPTSIYSFKIEIQ